MLLNTHPQLFCKPFFNCIKFRRKRGSNTWQPIWLVTWEMCPSEYRRSQVGVPSSEALLQLAIFDRILPLDECFRFQIMTERQANGLSAEPGCASSLPQAFMATFPDGFLKRQTSASGIQISLSHFVKRNNQLQKMKSQQRAGERDGGRKQDHSTGTLNMRVLVAVIGASICRSS